MQILLPVSILHFLSSSACNSALTWQIWSELDNHWQELWRHIDFQDRGHLTATSSHIYCRFQVLWSLAFRKANNYLRTKFRERWNCRTGHWRTTSQGWPLQDWTIKDCISTDWTMADWTLQDWTLTDWTMTTNVWVGNRTEIAKCH